MLFNIHEKIKTYPGMICFPTEGISRMSIKSKIILSLVIIFVVSSILYFSLFKAPSGFPVGRLIEIEKGMALSDISKHLKNSSVIRSELLFESFVTMLTGDDGAMSGEYFFVDPVSSWNVAKKITKGEYGLTPVKITIPEGSTVYDTARLFEDKFPDFDSVEFLKIVVNKEGYLFPDTYLFLPNVKADQVVREMEENFKRKLYEIREDIMMFDKPLDDIIIMASILEKEARTTQSRRMISGILWKRIEIDMPLQVDAVFPYINGKNTYTLTLKDLKIDSPYNTYKYKGLPVGPISNPGLDSIMAAVNPEGSENLYYLSDRVGNMYYAKDFDAHKKNKRLYLN